jgi:hypothetical protein
MAASCHLPAVPVAAVEVDRYIQAPAAVSLLLARYSLTARLFRDQIHALRHPPKHLG